MLSNMEIPYLNFKKNRLNRILFYFYRFHTKRTDNKDDINEYDATLFSPNFLFYT